MFEAEARGLRLLYEADAIRIPRVIGTGRRVPWQFIIMEFISGANRAPNFWDLLGRRLASLHRTTRQSYGLDHDNYIGSLRQLNAPSDSWIDFFINQRLQVQLKLAADTRRIGPSVLKRFEQLYTRLPGILVVEPPSLLHGD